MAEKAKAETKRAAASRDLNMGFFRKFWFELSQIEREGASES